MSFKLYKYLNADDSSGSESLDANDVTIYTLNVTNAINTFSVGLDGNPRAYELIGTGLEGSGTVKLQFSLDGILWTDAVDNSGNAVSFTMSSSTLQEVVKDFQVIGTAHHWVISGSNTAGTLTIKVV